MENILFLDDEENILKSVSKLFADRDFHFFTTGNTKKSSSQNAEYILLPFTHKLKYGMKSTGLLPVVKDISPDTVRSQSTAQAHFPINIKTIITGKTFKLFFKQRDTRTDHPFRVMVP